MIDCARDAGLVAITEVGRKDPKRQPTAEELAEQVLQGLGLGRLLGDHRRQGVRRRASAFTTRRAISAPVFLTRSSAWSAIAAPRLIWEAPLAHPAGLSSLPLRRQC